MLTKFRVKKLKKKMLKHNLYFLARAGKGSDVYFPVIQTFTGNYAGLYRCEAALPCDEGETQYSNFTFNLNISKLTSSPKAHIECDDCVTSDVCAEHYRQSSDKIIKKTRMLADF